MWLKFFARHCGDLGWALGPRCYQFNQSWKLAKNQPGTGHPITGPKIIHDCKKVHGGSWQMWSNGGLFLLQAMHMKWWKKVFFHLFSLSILNTYILCKQRTFQRELVKELVRNSGIFPSLTPRGHPAKRLTHLQAGGQRKYWALGRSPTSPGHLWSAFLPQRRSWQG